MKLTEEFSMQQMSEQYCQDFKDARSGKLTGMERKELEHAIKEFRSYSNDEILKTLIVYAIFEPDECIWEARRRGVFRYSNGRGNVAKLIEELLKNKVYL